MVVKKSARNSIHSFDKEFFDQHVPSLLMIGLGYLLEFFTLIYDREKDVHEELERVLIEEMNLGQAVKREEDS